MCSKVSLILLVIVVSLTCCRPRQIPSINPSVSALHSPLVPTLSAGQVYAFRLDKPIRSGTMRVTGGGPPGVPIIIVDITFGGLVLATGNIDQSGRFVFELNQPLEANHRIGLGLGNLSGTPWESIKFDSKFYGGEPMNVPLVGFFFDTCLVSE
jgi:hypothetical protein